MTEYSSARRRLDMTTKAYSAAAEEGILRKTADHGDLGFPLSYRSNAAYRHSSSNKKRQLGRKSGIAEGTLLWQTVLLKRAAVLFEEHTAGC